MLFYFVLMILLCAFMYISAVCDLLADDDTLNTANDNIENIRRDLQQI